MSAATSIRQARLWVQSESMPGVRGAQAQPPEGPVLAHVLLFFQLSAVAFLAATDAGGSVAVGAAGMGWSR